MIKTKHLKLFLSVITFMLCVLLFLQRLTGGILHGIFGIILIIVAGVHLCRQNAKLMKRARSIRVIDLLLISALVILFLTGILLHPLHQILVLKIIHKLSAVLFVIGIIAHLIQHKR